MQKNNKNIVVFNKKGGVGKTSLAFNIAKDLGYALLSNDDSVIESIYPNKAKILKQIQLIDYNAVYDFGGFIDAGMIDVFKNASIILIPTLLDINSIKRTINTTMEISKYCNRIIIVINRYEKSKISKYKQSINALEGLGVDIFYIRESEAITNSMHLGKTISELYNESPLSKHSYQKIFDDYQKILQILQGSK